MYDPHFYIGNIKMDNTLFNQLLTDTLSQVAECEAAAYIDLECGQLLGTYADPDYADQRILPLITDAVNELFTGQNVAAISKLLKEKEKLAPEQEYFNEITISGINHSYVCMRTQFNYQHVVAFVYRNSVGRGMMLSQSKQFLKKIEEVAEKTETPCCEHHVYPPVQSATRDIVELELDSTPNPVPDYEDVSFSNLPSNFVTITRSNNTSHPTPYDMLDEINKSPRNKYRNDNDIISALDKFLGR